MASQFTAPILIPSGAPSQPLQRLPLSGRDASAEYDEAWLQQLLFRHPGALPIDEIDRAYSGAVPICTELYTPAGYIDALYATPQGKLVVLEAKLWHGPEARRTVIGQILDYAKELGRWTYEDLQRAVTRRTGRHGNALFDIVNDAVGGLNEPAFIDEVARSLRQDRDGIENDLDVPVEWNSEDGKHRVEAWTEFPDIRDPQCREAILDFLADRANRFVNAFRTRIQRIAEEH